jgi:phosphopantetheinyl transferase
MVHLYSAFCDPTPQARHEKAWELLYLALSEVFGLSPEDLQFSRNENGKPFLSSHGGIFFSLAHGQDCAVCAISDEEIGVDCEKIRPVSARVKKNALSLSAEADDIEALRRWTRLESYAKMLGGRVFGMNYEKDVLNLAEETCLFEDRSSEIGNGYVITLCRRKPDKK